MMCIMSFPHRIAGWAFDTRTSYVPAETSQNKVACHRNSTRSWSQ